MANPDTTFIRRWQQHIEAKLLSEPLLNKVGIALMRRQVLLQPEQRIAPHLAGRTVNNVTYTGSGILINLPICLPSEDRDVEGAQLDALTYIDLFNEDNIALAQDTGSGLTAEYLLIITWMILNQFLDQDLASGNATIETVMPIEDKLGAYGYRLPVKLRMAQNGPTKCAAPVIAFTSNGNGTDTVTITCTTAGATIYYTTDESFPGPYTPNQSDEANTSTVYTEPFTVNSGTIICVTAFIQNSTTTIGSDLWADTAP